MAAAQWSDETNHKRSEAMKGRKQSPEHIAARTAARKAKGSWFAVDDVGHRISEGKKKAFSQMTDAEKAPFQKRARALGEARRLHPDKFCEREGCPNKLTGSNARQPQRRFCSIPCRNMVIKGWKDHVKLGEDRICPVDGTLFWIARKNLLPINYCSHTCRQKVRTGDRNSNWRNGSTAESDTIRMSEPYRQWRMAVFLRDEFLCQDCGADTILHAHHLKEFAKYPELRFDVANGITVCRDCHEIRHGGRQIFDSRVDSKNNRANRASK